MVTRQLLAEIKRKTADTPVAEESERTRLTSQTQSIINDFDSVANFQPPINRLQDNSAKIIPNYQQTQLQTSSTEINLMQLQPENSMFGDRALSTPGSVAEVENSRNLILITCKAENDKSETG